MADTSGTVRPISQPLRKLVVCCVCQVGYIQEMECPISMPCLHTICTKCLDVQVARIGQKDSITCPICVTSCKVPSGGIEALPSDTFYYVMRESLIRPHDEIPPVPAALCRIHKDEEVTLYCDTCLLPVCHTCWQQHHQSHQMKEMEETANSLDFEMRNTLIYQLEACMTDASENLDNLRDNRNKMTADLKEARDRIRKEARRLRDEISHKEAMHMGQLNHTELEMTPVLNKAQEMYESFFETIQALKLYTDTLYRKGSNYDKACHVRGIKTQFQKERQLQFETFMWESTMTRSEEDITDQEPRSILGELNIAEQVLSPLKDAAGVATEGPFLEKTLRVLTECQNKIGFQEVHFPDFSPLFDQLCIMHVHHDEGNIQRLCIHGEDGAILKQLVVPGIKSFGRSAVQDSQSGRVVVSDLGMDAWQGRHMSGSFHWLTFNPEFDLVGHSVTRLQCSPCMCTIGPTGEVLLTTRCPYEEHPARLLDMDKDGTLVRSITLADDTFRCPLSAVRTDNGYVIADTIYDHLVWIDTNGTYLRSFSQHLLRPFIFSCHPVGVLLVPDWGSHKVRVLGRDREFTIEVLNRADGVKFPRRVYMDHKAGLLYVAQSQHGVHWEVKVFRFNVRAHRPVSRHLKMTFHL